MSVILKPIITEKMTLQGEKLNRYGFVVRRAANKLQIKKEVESLYGVEVKDVNTLNYSGKRKTRYTRSGYVSGKTRALKKAVVTLAEGQTIDFYSNI
ncbi:MAG: 50S ribosomal protein L23 [Bacteroidales bacterium]